MAPVGCAVAPLPVVLVPSWPLLTCSFRLQVYHPNIDLEGKICLNILREDWKPVLSISSVVYGLQFLFLDPNPDDPLVPEIATLLRTDRAKHDATARDWTAKYAM